MSDPVGMFSISALASMPVGLVTCGVYNLTLGQRFGFINTEAALVSGITSVFAITIIAVNKKNFKSTTTAASLTFETAFSWAMSKALHYGVLSTGASLSVPLVLSAMNVISLTLLLNTLSI